MMIIERDVNILKFINEFGFCEINHIRKMFQIGKSCCYRNMLYLVNAGLVRHERILFGKPGIYRLTQKGASFTDLPPITKVPTAIYDHQLAIIDVYMKLMKLHQGIKFISERQLQQDKFFTGIGKSGHLSDGLIIFPDGKQIAIEVELTLKGKNRVEKIFKQYAAQFDIKEVWYYCLPNLIQPLSNLSLHLPFIKMYNLVEFLA